MRKLVERALALGLRLACVLLSVVLGRALGLFRDSVGRLTVNFGTDGVFGVLRQARRNDDASVAECNARVLS